MTARIYAIVIAIAVLTAPLGVVWFKLNQLPRQQHSIDDRLEQFGSAARNRLLAHFLRAEVPYPPARIVLVGLKEERRLQIYAPGRDGTLRYVMDHRIVAAAGGPGPKLRAGDHQVPEGSYRLRYLNPNSAAYVSLMIGYPNAFDKARAQSDGRTKLGGDIVIHGPTTGTEGCLALGEDAVEEIFTLVADAGITNTEILITPRDFRSHKPPGSEDASEWTRALYARIAHNLAKLPAPEG